MFVGMCAYTMEQIRTMPSGGEEDTDWYSLKHRDGGAKQQAMSLAFMYTEDETDPKKRRQAALVAKAEAYEAQKKAMEETGEVVKWVSAWDVREVSLANRKLNEVLAHVNGVLSEYDEGSLAREPLEECVVSLQKNRLELDVSYRKVHKAIAALDKRDDAAAQWVGSIAGVLLAGQNQHTWADRRALCNVLKSRLTAAEGLRMSVEEYPEVLGAMEMLEGLEREIKEMEEQQAAYVRVREERRIRKEQAAYEKGKKNTAFADMAVGLRVVR